MHFSNSLISDKDYWTNYACKLINTILNMHHIMSETRKGSYTCSDCGASFSTHEGLVNHNVDAHGAALGAQLRQSEEIQKQRREE
jgi:transcription elongation factor Elf1